MNSIKEDRYYADWKEREELAEAMLPLIGRLYRRGVVTTIYGRGLVRASVIDILKAHRFARQILENELSVRDTSPLLEALGRLDLAPARIDLGKLAMRYQSVGGDVDAFVARELAAINIGQRPVLEQPRDVRTSAVETLQRLEALQQSVEAIAVEVERISEAQRFTTKLLADRGQRAEPTR